MAGADSNCCCKGKDGRERGGGDNATTDVDDDDEVGVFLVFLGIVLGRQELARQPAFPSARQPSQ